LVGTGSSFGSDPARAIPAGRVARGRVRLPGSKSASHRHLNLALLAQRPVALDGLLAADDIGHFLTALEQMGWLVEKEGSSTRLAPPVHPAAGGTVYAGNAGTLCRFLTATLAAVPGRWILDGAPRLRERPLGPLVSALRDLGARIRYRGHSGFPPLEIEGGELVGGRVALDAGSSSQYLSALLMAALVARRPTEIAVEALTSAPYVGLTLRAIDRWGGSAAFDGSTATIRPGIAAPERVAVPADDSAAAYPAAAAVLTGGDVELLGLDPESGHGDRRMMEILERMGGEVSWSASGGLRVRGTGAPLQAVDQDMGDVPDQVPTLAALAPFARGTTRIRNVGHLRIKESDRLAAMAAELARLGATVEELEDGLVVRGTWADAPPPSEPVTVATWDDHRIAMSLALVGLRRPGVTVADPGVVDKSYPGFWCDFEDLLS
jgi:3-phosphoshikimate 1-carboxyvinyltransferase